MSRPVKCRTVEFEPRCRLFRPVGVSGQCLEELILTVEEVEAIRLKDILKLEQEECAGRMGVSRATFQRVLAGARSKLAEAIVDGKAVRVAGGNYCLAGEKLSCHICSCKFKPEGTCREKESPVCPACAYHGG